MKNVKRFFSIMLTLAMVLSLCVAVFAAESTEPTTGSITIGNTDPGQTYEIYKAFDLTYSYDNKADTKTVIYFTSNQNLLDLLWENKEEGLKDYDAWEKGDNPVCPFYIGDPVDDIPGAFYVYHLYGGEINVTNDAAGRGWLNSTLEQWKNGVYTKNVIADENTETFSGIPFGYYLITTTTGSIVTVNSTTPDITVYDKNEMTPKDPTKTADKVFVTDGEKVTFTSTLEVTNYKNSTNDHNDILSYTANDNWDAGLSFDFSTGIKSVRLFKWKEITAIEYNALTDKTNAKTEGTGDNVKYFEKNYVQTFAKADSFTPGLASNKGKYVLTVGTDSETKKSGYKLTIPWASYSVADDGKVSNIVSFYQDPVILEIVYEMTVNDNIFANQKKFSADNTMVYTYERNVNGTPTEGGGEQPQTVTVYSLGISLRKTEVGGDDTLSGAQFIVYKDVKEGNNTVRYYYTNKQATLTYTNNKANFVTSADGKQYEIIWISAKDYTSDPEESENGMTAEEKAKAAATRMTADNSYDSMEVIGLLPGEYFIEEVKAPKGYNLPNEAFKVTIEEDTTEPGTATFTYDKGENTEGIKENNGNYSNAYSTSEIENGTNAPMPTTGGAGTVALVACGAIAFLGTGVILVTKKRMYNQG